MKTIDLATTEAIEHISNILAAKSRENLDAGECLGFLTKAIGNLMGDNPMAADSNLIMFIRYAKSIGDAEYDTASFITRKLVLTSTVLKERWVNEKG